MPQRNHKQSQAAVRVQSAPLSLSLNSPLTLADPTEPGLRLAAAASPTVAGNQAEPAAAEGSSGRERPQATNRKRSPDAAQVCKASHHFTSQQSVQAAFKRCSSALADELVAFAAAAQECERDTLGGSRAQKERRRRLMRLSSTAVASIETCALVAAASKAAAGVLEKELISSESRHRKRDAFLVENLVQPIVARVGGSVGGGTLEGALLSLTQMRRGEVSFNVNKMVGTDEDGEPLVDFFSPIYVPMPLAEKLKDLEIQQAERLAELPALARDFDAAFEAAAGAGSGFVDEANRAAARSPRAIEWLLFFACVDAASYKHLITACGAAAESATKRVDGVFTALVESAEKHLAKDQRDEVLLDCLRAIASGKKDEREAAEVAAILEEFDSARALSARQDASRSCKRGRGDGGGGSGSTGVDGASGAAGDACGDVEDMGTGAPPSPQAVVDAVAAVAAAAAEDVDAAPAEDVDAPADAAASAAAAAAAASAAVVSVVRNRAAFAVLPSGPMILDDEAEDEMMVIETAAGGSVYVRRHAAAAAVRGNGNGNRNIDADDDDDDADDENADDPSRDAHALFFAHWLPPSTRTPEQIAEILRAPNSFTSAPAWPAEQPPAVFLAALRASQARVTMRLGTGAHSVDFSELRTDADIDTLAHRVRGLMGAPERGSAPAMHASYVLLSNDNALPAGVPPPQPNIASFPPRRFPRTRQRPQAQIDGEAASKARAQQAVAHMQTMMAAAVEAARNVPAPIPL